MKKTILLRRFVIFFNQSNLKFFLKNYLKIINYQIINLLNDYFMTS